MPAGLNLLELPQDWLESLADELPRGDLGRFAAVSKACKAVGCRALQEAARSEIGRQLCRPYAFVEDRLCRVCPELVLPEGVTEITRMWITKSRFQSCTSLRAITLPASIKSIGPYGFFECRSLVSVTILASITTIEHATFRKCRSLVSVTLPATLITIESFAFSDCSSLLPIALPDSLVSIGTYAFSRCSSLISLTIPASVTAIEAGAFAHCFGLTSLALPNGLTKICESAFLECRGLTSLTIPASLTEIGEYAFARSGLTSLSLPLPANLTIGDLAFLDCHSLEEPSRTAVQAINAHARTPRERLQSAAQ